MYVRKKRSAPNDVSNRMGKLHQNEPHGNHILLKRIQELNHKENKAISIVEPRSDNALRLTLPIHRKRHFFPFRKRKLRPKTVGSNPRQSNSIIRDVTHLGERERDFLLKAIQRSGKFADADHVEINPQTQREFPKSKRYIRSVSFDKSHSSYIFPDDVGEGKHENVDDFTEKPFRKTVKKCLHSNTDKHIRSMPVEDDFQDVDETRNQTNTQVEKIASPRTNNHIQPVSGDGEPSSFAKILKHIGRSDRDHFNGDLSQNNTQKKKDAHKIVSADTSRFTRSTSFSDESRQFAKISNDSGENKLKFLNENQNYTDNGLEKPVEVYVEPSNIEYLQNYMDNRLEEPVEKYVTSSNKENVILRDKLLRKYTDYRPEEPVAKHVKPSNIENVISQDLIYNLLKVPTKILGQFTELKHFIPALKSFPEQPHDPLPNTVSTFEEPLTNWSKLFAGSFENIPRKVFLEMIKPKKRVKRNTSVLNNGDYNYLHPITYNRKNLFSNKFDGKIDHNKLEEVSKTERTSEKFATNSNSFAKIKTMFKNVGDDIENNGNIPGPVTRKTRNLTRHPMKSMERDVNLKNLTPQLFLNVPAINMNEDPVPLKFHRRRPSEVFKNVNEHNLKHVILDIVEDNKFLETLGNVENFDNVSFRIVQEKIMQTLNSLRKLVDVDFGKNYELYQQLLKLQNMKSVITYDWKRILDMKNNEESSRMQISEDILEMQAVKDEVVKVIVELLIAERGVNEVTLENLLLRIQKLQCVFKKIRDEFHAKIALNAPFEVERELKYVDQLNNICLIRSKYDIELYNELITERNEKLKSDIALLEKLKTLLDLAKNINYFDRFQEAVKIIWEMKNLTKIKQLTIRDLKDKITHGQKLRRDLKILFDLHKGLELCDMKLQNYFEQNFKGSTNVMGSTLGSLSRFGVRKPKMKPSKIFSRHIQYQ